MPCPDEGQCLGLVHGLSLAMVFTGPASYIDCRDRNWDGTGQGWNGVDLHGAPEPERAGLLTRMSMLAHDTVQARPIQRGLKIRELLLCDPVPPPENCEVVKPHNSQASVSLTKVQQAYLAVIINTVMQEKVV